MDKEAKKENTSLLPNCINNTNNHNNDNDNIIIDDDSPKKPPLVGHTSGGCGLIGSSGNGNIGGDHRLKRDEWSEGAVSCLLEAYESKWILRNRAKLKGHDWEDVAKYVSSRANSTKTQTQCKNKIESMKKRYRSESAAADASSWPLFPRLDLLLRGSAPPPPPPALPPPIMLIEPLSQSNPAAPPLRPPPSIYIAAPPTPTPALAPTPTPAPAPVPIQLGDAQNSHGSNGVDRVTKEDGMDTKMSDHVADKTATETDSSTPALYGDTEKLKSKNDQKTNYKKRPRRREDWEIADSIRWLAEVVVRSEQARVETMRELEKMRVEAEAKRGEIDLKRTEIIANTQLEIARLFAGIGKGVDPSLRIGRS